MTTIPTKHLAMTHRQILEALSGLLVALFVAILSSTIVSNALPIIIADLKGSQAAYTWVVTSTLLATTVSTPIWGKLADLYSKKVLVQAGLVIFTIGSALAGLSESTSWLIGCRVLQGLGAGGLTALVQVVIAAMIPPRERGRYSGYIGAAFGLATVGGPLIGGGIVDTSWLGWRWCFYVAVPFSILSFVLLQKTLKLPVAPRGDTKIDVLGATFLTGGVSSILIWISLAGHNFAWVSGWSALMIGLFVVLIGLAILTEAKVKDPVIPLTLFKRKTVALSTTASIFVGVAMFGATVFLSQYFQISRGVSPVMSGVSTIPLIAGLITATTTTGRLITKTGKWKRFLVTGGVMLTLGLGLFGTMDRNTPYWHLAIFMVLLGAGVGMLMQNLVLAVQNTLQPHELGTGSALVAFFRSLGGAIGVAGLGAVLSHRVVHYITNSLPAGTSAGSSNSIPDLKTLPPGLRLVVENAYGNAVADIFTVAAPLALIAFICVLFIKEVPLRTKNEDAIEQAAEVTL